MAGSVIVLIVAILAAIGIAYYFMNKPVDMLPKEDAAEENGQERLGASAIDAATNINYSVMEEIIE